MNIGILPLILLFVTVALSIVAVILATRGQCCLECIPQGQKVKSANLQNAVKRINESQDIKSLQAEVKTFLEILTFYDKFMSLVYEFTVKLNNESDDSNVKSLKSEISNIIVSELKHEQKQFKQEINRNVRTKCFVLLTVLSFFLFLISCYLFNNSSCLPQENVVTNGCMLPSSIIFLQCCVIIGIIVVCISMKKRAS